MNIKTSNDLMMAKRKIAKKYGIKILENSEILKYLKNAGSIKKSSQPPFAKGGNYKKSPSPPLSKGLIRILRKRAIRTMSGIAPVAVLTKPYPCPGKCAYCPTEKDVPQSYLSNEPAVMRAIRCGYNPYKQTQLRLRALEANGHEPTKIEIIVIGGTWSALPEEYKYWYIKECFRGANDYQLRIKNYELRITDNKFSNKLKIDDLRKKLLKEQKKNENAKYKIIGLTLETRPDYIDEGELLQMRELGCTRVELGVQAVDDEILKKNKRGHGVKEVTDATKLLRDFGFKITYHIMPGLPGATSAKDLKMFKQLFNDERFQPDQIKFYPTVVTRGSLLYRWWRAGKYKPYSDKVLQKLIVECKKAVPEYVRIIRLIRDIPGESIVAGNKITNLRQVMQQRGVECRCIRCREAREREFKVESLKLKVIKYRASDGWEYFLQYMSKGGETLYGFCRLRLPNVETQNFASLRGAAIIRELHVYGELVPVGNNHRLSGARKIQHAGLGKKLMLEAEKIAEENGYKKIAVISGVGARGYYRKLGYKLKNTYMVK